MPFPAASVLLGTPLLRAGAHPPGASCPDHQTLPDPQPITLSQSSSSIAVPHSSCRTLLGGCGPLPRGQAVPTGPPTGQSAGPCPARPGSACVAGFQRGSRSSADPWEREVGNSPETSEPSCDEGPGLRLPARGRAAARWPFPAEATPAELGGEAPAAGVRPSLQSPLPAPTLLFAPPARPPPSPPALCAASTSSAPADSSVHPGPAPRAGTSVRAPGGVPDGPPHTPPHWSPGLPPSVGDALLAPCSPPVHAPRVGSWGPILSHVLCSQAHPASLPTPTTLQGLPSGPASPADR